LIVCLFECEGVHRKDGGKPWRAEEQNGIAVIFSSCTFVLSLKMFKLLESQRITEISVNENGSGAFSRQALIFFSSNQYFWRICDFLSTAAQVWLWN